MDSSNVVIKQIIPEIKEMTEVTLDSLYVEIATIKDTLASVSQHTAPTNFLGFDSSISNSWIALVAMIVGFIAAFYGYKGFKYQKIASEELKSMVPKRVPLLPFLKKLYDNSIIIRLVYDFSLLSKEEENEPVPRNTTDHEFRYLPWESLLTSAMLPEAMFDLNKYEKYDDPTIYISAVEMRMRWQEYNNDLKIAIDELRLERINDLTFEHLLDMTESVARYLIELDDLICKAEEKQFKKPYTKNQLATDFKEIITSHFLVNLRRNYRQNTDIFDNIADTEIMGSTFCDNYSCENDLFLSSFLNRIDRNPIHEEPLTIKTYLLRTELAEALQTLEEIATAFGCVNKQQLNEVEQDDLRFKNNLDEVFGQGCAQKLYGFYTSGAARFNDIIGYDIYLRLCQYKVQYVDWGQLQKESLRFSQNKICQDIPNLNVRLDDISREEDAIDN